MAYLAKRIGISKGAFNNKVKGNNGAKFTQIELLHIDLVLDELSIDSKKTSEHL